MESIKLTYNNILCVRSTPSKDLDCRMNCTRIESKSSHFTDKATKDNPRQASLGAYSICFCLKDTQLKHGTLYEPHASCAIPRAIGCEIIHNLQLHSGAKFLATNTALPIRSHKVLHNRFKLQIIVFKTSFKYFMVLLS
eukprot:286489-Amphidinium_carterae.1